MVVQVQSFRILADKPVPIQVQGGGSFTGACVSGSCIIGACVLPAGCPVFRTDAVILRIIFIYGVPCLYQAVAAVINKLHHLIILMERLV